MIKTFEQYLKLKENFSKDIFGVDTTVTEKDENAVEVILDCFIKLLSKNPGVVLKFLEDHSKNDQEISNIIQQIDLNNVRNLKQAAIEIGKKIGNNIGFGDMNGANMDEIKPPPSDSM